MICFDQSITIGPYQWCFKVPVAGLVRAWRLGIPSGRGITSPNVRRRSERSQVRIRHEREIDAHAVAGNRNRRLQLVSLPLLLGLRRYIRGDLHKHQMAREELHYPCQIVAVVDSGVMVTD